MTIQKAIYGFIPVDDLKIWRSSKNTFSHLVGRGSF